MVATVTAPRSRALRTAVAAALRDRGQIELGRSRPGRRRAPRGAGSAPRVYSTSVSPLLPVKSPAAITSLIAPPSARSTAPVAPPGAVTPWNRLTIDQVGSDFGDVALFELNIHDVAP